VEYALRMTGTQHMLLGSHLFPEGDDNEAVALLLCGRRSGKARHVFTVNKVILIPHDKCGRSPDSVTWPTTYIDDVLEACYKNHLAIVKIHSHPTGYPRFSPTDDESDRDVYGAISSLLDDGLPHASLVMLPGEGRMFGRVIIDGVPGNELDLIQVVGDDLCFFHARSNSEISAYAERHAQAFGKGTANILSRLTVAVVGCSGTGSIVVELLARLGVKRLILIDPDRVEEKNLNRILNSGKEDAYLSRPKVEVLAKAIARMGLGQEVEIIAENLICERAIHAVAGCDVVFGCMDGVEGRHWLNRIATFYNLPYFDVGVRLDADGNGGIDCIAGAVHYLQPGMSSLLSRGVYSMDRVTAEALRRTNPAEYARQLGEGYIRGVVEDRPAVISVNMFFASMIVNEFLARLHEYRNRRNSEYGTVQGNLSEVMLLPEPEIGECQALKKHVGRGDCIPLLDRPSLS